MNVKSDIKINKIDTNFSIADLGRSNAIYSRKKMESPVIWVNYQNAQNGATIKNNSEYNRMFCSIYVSIVDGLKLY